MNYRHTLLMAGIALAAFSSAQVKLQHNSQEFASSIKRICTNNQVKERLSDFMTGYFYMRGRTLAFEITKLTREEEIFQSLQVLDFWKPEASLGWTKYHNELLANPEAALISDEAKRFLDYELRKMIYPPSSNPCRLKIAMEKDASFMEFSRGKKMGRLSAHMDMFNIWRRDFFDQKVMEDLKYMASDDPQLGFNEVIWSRIDALAALYSPELHLSDEQITKINAAFKAVQDEIAKLR